MFNLFNPADPLSPGLVSLTYQSPTSLTVSWIPAAGANSFDFYRVSITDPSGNENFADPVYPSESTEHTFNDLDPLTDYTATVVTVLEADAMLNLAEQTGDTTQRQIFQTGEHVKRGYNHRTPSAQP